MTPERSGSFSHIERRVARLIIAWRIAPVAWTIPLVYISTQTDRLDGFSRPTLVGAVVLVATVWILTAVIARPWIYAAAICVTVGLVVERALSWWEAAGFGIGVVAWAWAGALLVLNFSTSLVLSEHRGIRTVAVGALTRIAGDQRR